MGKRETTFKIIEIIEEPTCPCGKGDPATDHIIYACERLTKERDRLKRIATRTNKWPANKCDLIRRHYKEFTKFINEIQFDKLNVE
jgi:hypothetical protein